MYIVDFTVLLHIAFELDETSKMFKRVVGLTAVMGFIGFAWLIVAFEPGSQEAEKKELEEKKQQEEEKRRKEEEEEKRVAKDRRRAARRESMIREGSVRESTPGL